MKNPRIFPSRTSWFEYKLCSTVNYLQTSNMCNCYVKCMCRYVQQKRTIDTRTINSILTDMDIVGLERKEL